MNIDTQLLKGSISIMILQLLSECDMYGYQIIKELELRSDNTFSLKEGTLYPVLHSLEESGAVIAYWENTKQARKRKYYHITEKGILEVYNKKAQWEAFSNAVNQVLDNRGKILGGVSNAKMRFGFFRRGLRACALP